MQYFNNDVFWVVVENGRLFMHDPNGMRINGEIYCRILDKANQPPKAFFMAAVNIAGSVEEMEAKIKEQKEK